MEPFADTPCLVEVWQNYNGQKLTWHEVMVWTGKEWILYSDPCKKLGSTQAVHRWAKISDISCWTEG